MKATEDFMETVLYSHILAVAKECTDSSRMTCNEVAKWIVKTLVKMTVPKFEEPSSATRPDSGATEPASNLTNATINPTSGIQLATNPTSSVQLATNPTSSVQPATNPTSSVQLATNPTSGAQSTYEEVINDLVHSYAVDFLGMALFWHAFHDAIRRGMETEFYVIGSICQLFLALQLCQQSCEFINTNIIAFPTAGV